MYQSTASFNPLNDEELHRFVPSIYADHADEQVSERYRFVPTINIVKGLIGEGWWPVRASQSSSRKENGEMVAKHMLRFRQESDNASRVGDTFPEIVLVNSHNRSSAVHLHAGIFRLICLNGCVVDDGLIAHVSRRHTGTVVEEVIEGVYEILDSLPKAVDEIDRFKAIELMPEEQRAFADSAALIRWTDPEIAETVDLNLARRHEDRKPDLWSSFNRVQENIIRGGVRVKGRRAKAVRSVDSDVRINKALWALADKMAELKEAA